MLNMQGPYRGIFVILLFSASGPVKSYLRKAHWMLATCAEFFSFPDHLKFLEDIS